MVYRPRRNPFFDLLVYRNLTDQVREIARVTTAVADGDLTR